MMKKIDSGESILDQHLLEVFEEKLKKLCPEDRGKLYSDILKSKQVQSAIFLIKNNAAGVESCILTASTQTPSIIFDMQEEKIFLEIISTFSPDVFGIMSTNGLGENILHYAIQKRWKNAVNFIISPENKRFRKLLHEVNLSGNTPIMTTLSQEMQDSAINIWNCMEEIEDEDGYEYTEGDYEETKEGSENDNMSSKPEIKGESENDKNEVEEDYEAIEEFYEEFEEEYPELEEDHEEIEEDYEETEEDAGNDNMSRRALKYALEIRNKNQETILLLCAGKKQNQLFKNICLSKLLTKNDIQEALTEQGPDGHTPLSLCGDQEVLVEILNLLNLENMDIGKIDKSGKNILHHLAKRDFNLAIEHLITCLPTDQLRDMLLHPSTSNNSNVLMTAAIHSSEKSLKLLLYVISAWRCFKSAEDIGIDIVLHSKNDYGNTLLALVLQHKDALQVPLHIILGLEREFHEIKGKDDFTKCFKENLVPSLEVLEALQEVEKTKEKSWLQIAGIWATTFVKSFCLPVGLMSLDMGLDIALVGEYSDHNRGAACLAAQYNACATTTAECHADTTSVACQSAINVTNNILSVKCGDDSTLWEWQPTEDMISSAFFCTPLKLELAPRFYYSLGFIVWPWVYYFIEFCQSNISQHIYQVIFILCIKHYNCFPTGLCPRLVCNDLVFQGAVELLHQDDYISNSGSLPHYLLAI